jgi:ribonuclease P protein component
VVFSFGKDERLRKRDEIQHVFSKGRKVSCAGARLFYRRNDDEQNRVLFTVVRGYGTAVERNHARRLGKEIYRVLKTSIVPGYDLIVLFYPERDEFSSRKRQLVRLFSEAGLLGTDGENRT